MPESLSKHTSVVLLPFEGHPEGPGSLFSSLSFGFFYELGIHGDDLKVFPFSSLLQVFLCASHRANNMKMTKSMDYLCPCRFPE